MISQREVRFARRHSHRRSARIKVVGCENTIRAQKLAQSDMLDGIGYAGAGVVEIMQRQQQGWAFLRP